MTHAIRIRLFTFCLAVLPAGIVFSLLLIFSPLAAISQQFQFTTNTTPGYVYLHGDLNNDGYEDLVVDNNNNIQVLLYNGGGTYRTIGSYPVQNYLFAPAALADFNGDGKLDMVVSVTENDPSGFYIYLGNGDGTFKAPVFHTVPGLMWGLAVEDVNHDNKPDVLALYGPAGGALSLQEWLGKGDGTFASGTTVKTHVQPNGNVLLTGDFDGDGKADVAVVAYESGSGTGIEVLYGDGDGHFPSTYTTSDASNLGAISADLNGDGISDLVASSSLYCPGCYQGEPFFTVYYGKSDRTLERVEISMARCTSGSPAVADFNGDGIPDLAFPETNCDGSGAATVTIKPGEGKGEFSSELPVYTYAEADGISGFSAFRGDLNSKPDLVSTIDTMPGSEVGEVVTLLNQTAGNFPTCAAPNAAVGIAQCSPTGSTVSSPVNFAVGAASDVPLRKVDVWVDRKKQAEQFAGAFSTYAFLNASIPLAAGSHRVSVIAYGWDNSQVSNVSTLNVTASSSCSAPSSAGVHICSPASGSSVSSPVQVQAAAKVTGTISSIQLWVDGVKKSSIASSTLNTSVSVAAGSHRFAVIAVNTAGTKWESTVNATVK